MKNNKKNEDFRKILALRRYYSNQLKKNNMEHSAGLIFKSKIIAIGEVLDILGYDEGDCI